MQGYGIESTLEGLLPWSWARERLERTKTFMVGSVTPDGAPHAAPIWALWIDEKLVFSTGERTRKARNLVANPRCTVTIEHDDEAVIIEGVTTLLNDDALKTRVLAAYSAKYEWDMSNDSSPWFVVHPRVAFGFIDKEGTFAPTATRWLFDPE